MGQRLYSQWKSTVANRGAQPALTEPATGDTCSFAELQAITDNVAHQLGSIENFKNRIIALQFPNSVDWLGTFLACQSLDAIALPIDPDVPIKGVEAILEKLKASAFINKSGTRFLENGTRRHPACLIKLTSGTTGHPKPLFFSDEQMLADGRNIMHTMEITAADSNLATIPFGHSYGLGNLVMPCILAGCTIQLCQNPFPHALSYTAARGRPTIYPAVPAIFSALSKSDVNPGDLKSIRLWISAGSVLEAKDAQGFIDKFHRPIHNFYGSSETGGIAYDRSGEDTLVGRSVGKPLHGVKISVSRSNRLIVEGPAVYTRNNRMSSKGLGRCLLPDKIVTLEDGSIQLAGRTARIAKIGGKRLSLAEVEKALYETNLVESCFVDVFKDSPGRIRLVAVVVSSVKILTIQNALKKKLAAWKIPYKWIPVNSIPLNARGKRDRSALHDLIQKATIGMGKP